MRWRSQPILKKEAPGSREHSDAEGGTRAECSPETGEKGSRRRVSIATPTSAGPGTDCPRRGAHEILARGIEAGWPRRAAARLTRARCGAAVRALRRRVIACVEA
jgi:hypothetical protein